MQINVPANWECEGHGVPIYTNFQYPWPITAPFVPSENPTGCYRLWFDVPSQWEERRHDLSPLQTALAAYYLEIFFSSFADRKGMRSCLALQRRIFLHFEGVNNAFYTWLNGTLLGYSQDSCLPAEFELSKLLKPGRNLLAVQV
jgi:beta-galactosidase